MRWYFYWLLIGATHHTHKWMVAGLLVMTHAALYHNKPNSFWPDVFVVHHCLSIIQDISSYFLIISKCKNVMTLLPLPPCGPHKSVTADSLQLGITPNNCRRQVANVLVAEPT